MFDSVIVESRREVRRSNTALLATSLRPEQWAKNFLLFAGLLFGGRLLEPDAVLTAIAAIRDVLCAVRRDLSRQRHLGSRGRSAPPAETDAPDCIRRNWGQTAGWSAAILIAGATAVAWVLNPGFAGNCRRVCPAAASLLNDPQTHRHRRRSGHRRRFRAPGRGRGRGGDRSDRIVASGVHHASGSCSWRSASGATSLFFSARAHLTIGASSSSTVLIYSIR